MSHPMCLRPMLLLLSVLVCATARAELPTSEYACHVITLEGVPGLVQLQVDSRQRAVEVAGKLAARTVIGGRAQAARVIECVQRPQGRFSDGNFQAFYANAPR